jgi:hypothetical protein
MNEWKVERRGNVSSVFYLSRREVGVKYIMKKCILFGFIIMSENGEVVR